MHFLDSYELAVLPVAETVASDSSIDVAETVVTDCSPDTTVIDFQTSLVWDWTARQPHCRKHGFGVVAPSAERRKVWLTLTAQVLHRNAANIEERKKWRQSELCT